MVQKFAYKQPEQEKVISEEQLQEIVAAIVLGKYSWACVLILRVAGYNPLNYIAYRTYNRLIKENCNCPAVKSKPLQRAQDYQAVKVGGTLSEGHSNQIEDLLYLQAVDYQDKNIIGGSQQL